MKSKLEIYALSVCFTTVLILVISAGIGGYAIFETITPQLTMKSYEYDRHQTNDAFWKDKNYDSEKEKTKVRPQ